MHASWQTAGLSILATVILARRLLLYDPCACLSSTRSPHTTRAHPRRRHAGALRASASVAHTTVAARARRQRAPGSKHHSRRRQRAPGVLGCRGGGHEANERHAQRIAERVLLPPLRVGRCVCCAPPAASRYWSGLLVWGFGGLGVSDSGHRARIGEGYVRSVGDVDEGLGFTVEQPLLAAQQGGLGFRV
jgi:hypothetical protein